MLGHKDVGLSAEEVHRISEAHAARAAKAKEDAGRATSMTCTCGGTLHEDAGVVRRARELAEKAVPRPRHRKKRILKKRLKVWEAKVRLVVAVSRPMLRPGYICGSCGQRSGFYSAVGRNLFKVEPMPPGATPIIEREPS